MNAQTYDILIKDTSYIKSDMQVVKHATIAIKEGRLSFLVDGTNLLATQELDGSSLLWMPGLVDGHLHTSQQLLRGRLLDERPVIWKRINVPFESTLTEQESSLSASLAALEMMKAGTTGFVDVGGRFALSFAQVYEQSGLRGRLSYMANDNPNAPASLRVTAMDAVGRMLDLHTQLTGRVKGYASVTALTAASENMIKQMITAAQENGIPFETHMNEYASEVFEFVERYQMRPFEYLENEGLLAGPFVAAHCIFLSEREKEIIQHRGVMVAHCPFSNCGKGVPDTPNLLARGVAVGFGTDGSAHGGLDLFKEIRLFRGVMNAVKGVGSADYAVMDAATLLKMATSNAAGMLNHTGLGTLVEGAPADLIALNMDQVHMWPTHNMVNTVVESASGSDVVHSIIDGRLVMKDRVVLTLDEEKIRHEAKQWAVAHGLV
ncbi:MAG: amidohydrolase family protein [Sphaerochaeta sp.]|jgi:5-methylthioadenosine/S-adenosylhomocysteine deaminase|uniref:amidohydrolase family protein n=1 Tax=Sphaerochaeta sp. TaxID=1972642 RepID=UPI003D0BE1AE